MLYSYSVDLKFSLRVGTRPSVVSGHGGNWEIVFRSGMFDEKHMLELGSYLSFTVCGFQGLLHHAAQSAPRLAIIPLNAEMCL